MNLDLVSTCVIKIDEKCSQLLRDNDLSLGELPRLRRRACQILYSRVHPSMTDFIALFEPDDRDEGIGGVFQATIDQSCIDALLDRLFVVEN